MWDRSGLYLFRTFPVWIGENALKRIVIQQRQNREVFLDIYRYRFPGRGKYLLDLVVGIPLM